MKSLNVQLKRMWYICREMSEHVRMNNWIYCVKLHVM